MVQGSRTFRIFVSSTFSDLKEERNALQNDVFPKLRELCMQHGCGFQAIDLRWGVSEEAGLDQQTMKICLEEIARCQRVTPRPNFIVLLGDRYGWRPLPSEIPALEFEMIRDRVQGTDKALLEKWYWRDDNAVLPVKNDDDKKQSVYCLQPRTGDFVDHLKWGEVENQLRTIFIHAIDGLSLTDDERLKYDASATEQEIYHGALKVKDAGKHVHCFFRTIHELPSGEAVKDFIDLDDRGNLVVNAKNKLENLKNRLKTELPDNIHHYDAQWSGNGITLDHLPGLCEEVYRSLSTAILNEISRIGKINETDNEVNAHDNFLKEKARFFTGRVNILVQIDAYLQSNDKHPLVIYGLSGSGKTALVAKAVEQAMQKYPESVIINRFIAATAGSTNVRSLLLNICKQISRRYGLDEATIPVEYEKLIDDFRVRLISASRDKPLILFLDALDQLSDLDNARSLAWLPYQLPDNMHLIVSVLPGECYQAIEKMVPATNIIKLDPMPAEEGAELFDLWMSDVSRTVQPWQKEEVLKKFSTNGLPLYLKLAYEEARRWKSYTSMTSCVLSSEITGIIRDLFKRLSSESNHGKVIFSKSLGYLAASRYGLAEDELIDVLSIDKGVLSDFKRRSPRSPELERLPIIVWSRLFFDLEPYMMEKIMGGVTLLSFYHRQIAEVASKEYFGEHEKTIHSQLADYFTIRPLEDRKTDELPWQLKKAENWKGLKDCITDMDIFLSLNSDIKQYELMGYWLAIGDRYDQEKEYNKTLEKYKNLDPERVVYYNNVIAHFFSLNAKFDGAELLYRRSLAIREKVLGPEHPDTGTALNNLASLLDRKGDYLGAETLYRRSLAIMEKVLGPEHPDTGIVLNNLALLLDKKGDYLGAETLYRRSLAIKEKVLGPEHLSTGTTLNGLAGLLGRKGDYLGAETLYRRSLAIKEKMLGPEHPNTGTALNNLASLLDRKGDYLGAETLYRRSLAIMEKVLGPEHPDTGRSLNNLASLLDRKGDYLGAEPFFRRALAINEKVLGPEHLNTAQSLNNLAILLGRKGDYLGAETLYRRSLAIMEKVLGPEHPDTVQSLNNLALLLYKKGDYAEAEPLYRRALAICEKVLGERHQDTITIRNNLNILISKKYGKNEKSPVKSFLKIFTRPNADNNLGKKLISVTIVSFGQVEDDITDKVTKSLKDFFQSLEDESICVSSFDIVRKPDPLFNRLSGRDTVFLSELGEISGRIVLGITDIGIHDDNPPRFIFGTSVLGKGILSTVRFKDKDDGREILLQRLGKESIKILALTCGVSHCPNENCMLTRHRQVEELDHSSGVCNQCKKRFAENLNNLIDDT